MTTPTRKKSSQDDHESPPDALDALVAGERASMTPPAGARDKTWERVVGTVGMGAPPAAGPSGLDTAGIGSATTAAAPWLKTLLGVMLAGLAASVAVVGYGIATDPAPTAAALPSTATVPTPRPEVAPPAPGDEAAAAPAHEALPPPANTVTQEPTARPARPSRQARPVVPTAGAPPSSDLAEETRLLARARAHVRAGSGRKALAPLHEHARRFPQGQLAEDRVVLQAQTLCELGETAKGTQALSDLREAFPGSSHLPRVRRACAQ